MQTGNYTGIGLIGNEDIAAIYAVNNGIVDINGTGIYHLFYKDYSHDLLQSAVTMIKAGNGIFYGNKIWHEYTHPHHIRPRKTYTEEHYRYCDEFDLEEIGLKRKDTAYAYGKNRLVFETEIENIGKETREISCYGYAAVRNTREIAVEELPGGGTAIHTGNVYMGMDTPTSDRSIPPLSKMEFFFTAETTPMLTPKSEASTIATRASSTVAGNLAIISSVTGAFVKYEVPRSPVSAPFMKSIY